MPEKLFTSEEIKKILSGALEHRASLRFQAKGFSMSPFIKNNDIITISPLGNRIPEPGDIVAFSYPPHALIVHRIIQINDNYLSLKGDIFPRDQLEIISSQDILGIVTRVERDGKKTLAALGWFKKTVAWASKQGLWDQLNNVVKAFRQKQPGH